MTQRRWPLPPEITERIIELLCLDRRYRYFRTIFVNLPGTAQYAGVCKEWQELVERRTFRNLRLTRARLADVDRIISRRRRTYVCTVDLNVELEPYGADVHGDFETAEENERNSVLFSETLRLFFNISSRWTPPNSGLRRERAGISLRIAAFSPSDVDRCGRTEMTRRRTEMRSHDIFADRYIHSIVRLLPGPGDLPAVESVSQVISGEARHISAPTWALIINSLPNAKKIKIIFWENEKKDLELRRRLRDEIGDALAQMRCPNTEVELTCSYEVPKDHSSIPPTLIDLRGIDNAFARGMRTWTQQLKRLFLSGVVISPEMFYAVASDEWPHLERLEVTYAAVTQHGTWLLDFNPGDSPRDRPSPVVDLEEFTQDSLAMEVPAPEDMYEYSFRTRPVATEMDPIHLGLARAVQRMPALKELYLVTWDGSIQWNHRYHAFLYRYNASKGVGTAHWGSLPGYTPAEEVAELWKEMAEVRGIQLEILIDENEV